MTYPPYGDQPQQPDPNQDQSQNPYDPNPYGQAPQGQSPYGQPYQPPYQPPYPQQSPYGQPYQAPYGYQAPAPTNGLAIASLVVSIISITAFCGLPSIVGAILGHVARRQIRERGQGGSGMALAGVIIGWIGVAVFVAFVLLMVIVIATDDSSSPTYTSGV